MDMQTKRARLEKLYVSSPRIKGILAEIEHCRLDSKDAQEPRSMLLIGQSGAGKTTIIKKYMRDFPEKETDERRIIPVFQSELPGKVTCKALAQTLLTEMGADDPESGNLTSITKRLARLIKECEVELIILDEFQHLLQSESAPYMAGVRDWIKSLINATKVPILLVGTPGSERILYKDPQLKRRFPVVEELAYFNWVDDAKDYRAFLAMVDKGLPFDEPANLADPHRAIRFLVASEGMIGNTMMLIYETGRRALEQGLPGLTDKMFAAAFDKHLLRESRVKRNPWGMTVDQLEKVIAAWADEAKRRPTKTKVKAAAEGSALAGKKEKKDS